MLGTTLQGPKKCARGGYLWLQRWCEAVGVGSMHAWLACAVCEGMPFATMGAKGGRRLCAMAALHLSGSWGSALDDDWSQPPAWWPRRNRQTYAERVAPPRSASIASKFISTNSGTCAKRRHHCDARGGSMLKICRQPSVQLSLSLFSVHPLSVPHSPMPPQNFLKPSTHPVTRGVMGAGSLSRGHGSAAGSGLCARDGQCRHPPAVAHMELKGGPRKCDRKRRAHV